MEEIARRFLAIKSDHGSEAIWPYWYAGTMGFVMRDGIERLTHVKNYSRMYGTFCIALSWPGFAAGVQPSAALMHARCRSPISSSCGVETQ